MRLDLEGKAVLVTGAASGIGLACARAFLAEGARVGMVDRGTVRPLGGETIAVRADVTDERALGDAVAEVALRFGGLDAVIGCAGVSGPVGTPLAETTAEEFSAVLAVNVTGQFLLAKLARPWLPRGTGAVVLLASDSAFTCAPGMVPYCASKGAVVALTRALAVELDGVRVNCVCPSVTDTPMARADLGDVLADPGFPVQTADDVAQHVLYLASERSRTVNGQALLADFGVSARSGFPA
ncbi:SDR family NAD(P)-dependent oxidoreductase [Amycolatopsis sp. CA-230715]|uniref:SDR family NAD(P)-dependent oxidoreductase n=1 Tax=Amycolatopsis sp. CA-230715 TaxID=2745196 RepID=UPI001C0097CD|nr:SDR family oxidoreductase [Amycolatopsis sp. CA-230715]QWF85366.1 Dihydroanticapsin 7-dehydrogenase [Amycolatopsis sp. CA-230715]